MTFPPAMQRQTKSSISTKVNVSRRWTIYRSGLPGKQSPLYRCLCVSFSGPTKKWSAYNLPSSNTAYSTLNLHRDWEADAGLRDSSRMFMRWANFQSFLSAIVFQCVTCGF